MKLFDRIGIKLKLQLIVFCAFLAIGFLAMFVSKSIKDVSTITRTINDHPMIVSNAASDSQVLIEEINVLNQQNYINNVGNNYNENDTKIGIKSLELESNMDTINKLIIGDEGKKLAEETRVLVDKWLASHNAEFRSIITGADKDLGKLYLMNQEKEAIGQLHYKLDAIQAYAKDKAITLTNEAKAIESNATLWVIFVSSAMLLLLLFFTNLIIKNITDALRELQDTMALSVEQGSFLKVDITGENEIADMGRHYNVLISKLEVQYNKREGLNKLSAAISGDLSLSQMADNVISFLSNHFGAGNGAFYSYNDTFKCLDLAGAFAINEAQQSKQRIYLGEGLVGQAGKDKQTIACEYPSDVVGQIVMSHEDLRPRYVVCVPLVYEGELCGVIELAATQGFTADMKEFLEEASKIIAVDLYAVFQNMKIQHLLKDSKEANKLLEEKQIEVLIQSDELLRNNNALAELLEKSNQQSEELQVQQEELKVSNEELEERTKLLEKQAEEIEKKNSILTLSKLALEQKSRDLETASKYKTEFLANMSHELRTPLNSILVLSQSLSEKKDTEPLTQKQLDYAKTINKAGNDLLVMINDVLDIAKVEAGKIELIDEEIQVKAFYKHLTNQFEKVAEGKGLQLNSVIDAAIPEVIISDRLRLEQILKNLISNAIKFTHQGSVTLTCRFDKAKPDWLVFGVIDTGIGIPTNKLGMIFEAFTQVDGTISRKFGGTGLGLSISLEYAKLMGGNIMVQSTEEQGSCFELILPLKSNGDKPVVTHELSHKDKQHKLAQLKKATEHASASMNRAAGQSTPAKPSKNATKKKVVICGDLFAYKIPIREILEKSGFNHLWLDWSPNLLTQINHFEPDALIINVDLSDDIIHGHYQELKNNGTTNSLPLYLMEVTGDTHYDSRHLLNLQMFLKDMSLRPIEVDKSDSGYTEISNVALQGKRILLADDDMRNVFALSGLLEEHGMEVISAMNGKEAIDRLMADDTIDLVIMDIMMPEMDGFKAMTAIRNIKAFEKLPIIALTAKSMKEDRIKCMEAGASEYITKPINNTQILNILKVWLHK